MRRLLNLHDELEKHSFEHAVLCTYTFAPHFFEEYCLDQFASLSGNGNITVLIDRRVYDGILAGPPTQWPRHANVRYLLHPVQVGRTFHPKVFLFATRTKGMLIVGSANLTRQGITSNAELAGVYRFEQGKREQHLGLFREAARFLRALADRWPGDDLSSNLSSLFSSASWLADGDAPPSPGRLIHNLDRPLWPQICQGLGGEVDAVHILSRYFDAVPHTLDRVADTLKPRTIGLWTQNGITTMTAAWLRHPLVVRGAARVRLCQYEDEGHRQPLHAKAVAVISGKTVRLAFGSANFTSAGLWSAAPTGNVETMIVIDELPLDSCMPERLFDPLGTSKPLVDARKLETAPREAEQEVDATLVRLVAAALEDGRLVCRCEASEEGASRVRAAVLTFSDIAGLRVALRPGREGGWFGPLDEAALRRCDDGATVVHLEGRPGERLSNRVLLLNLQDMVSNTSQRRERRIHEAQQSAMQFARVLDELLAANDTAALIRFLTLCDIPILNAARALAFNRPRPAWTGDDEMRQLGEHNLREYASLHEATVGFCDRHLRRLERHCRRVSIEGIPNFMHIALAIGRVLRAQVERALIGLEHLRVPLSNLEWGGHRDRLDCYLDLFKRVVDVVVHDYVPQLSELYNKASLWWEVLQPDVAPLTELCASFRRTRDRIDACMKNGLSVKTPRGDRVPPFIRDDNVIAPRRWHAWDQEVGAALSITQGWMEKYSDLPPPVSGRA